MKNSLEELERQWNVDPSNNDHASKFIQVMKRFGEFREDLLQSNIKECILSDLKDSRAYKYFKKFLCNQFHEADIYLVGGQIYRRIMALCSSNDRENYLNALTDWDFVIDACAHETVNIFYQIENKRKFKEFTIEPITYLDQKSESSDISSHSKRLYAKSLEVKADIISGCDIKEACEHDNILDNVDFADAFTTWSRARLENLEKPIKEAYLNRVPLMLQQVMLNIRTDELILGDSILKDCCEQKTSFNPKSYFYTLPKKRKKKQVKNKIRKVWDDYMGHYITETYDGKVEKHKPTQQDYWELKNYLDFSLREG